MAAFCPNIKSGEVLRSFNKLVKILGAKPMTIKEFKSLDELHKRSKEELTAIRKAYAYWDVTKGSIPQGITKQQIEKTIVEDSLKEDTTFKSIDEIIYSIPEIEIEFTTELPTRAAGRFKLKKYHKTGVIMLNEAFADKPQLLAETKAHELIHGILNLKYKESHKNIKDYPLLEWHDGSFSAGLSFGKGFLKNFNTKLQAEDYIRELINIHGEPVSRLKNFQESNLKKELDELWSQIKNNENISDFMRQYIDKNIEELVTFGLSNPVFAELLNNIQYKGKIKKYQNKSIFSVILELFLNIVTQKGSVRDKLLSVLETYENNIQNIQRVPSNIKYELKKKYKYSLKNLSSFSVNEDVVTVEFKKIDNTRWKYKATAYKGESFEEIYKDWTNISNTDSILIESLKDYNRIQEYSEKNNQKQEPLLQKSTEETIPPIEKLNDFLIDFLLKLGVKTEVYDTLKDRLKVDANGAADLINKLVLIAKGKEKRDTLPEEFGHVVLDALKDDKLYNKILELAKKTSLYQEVKEEYSEAYNNDEHLLAKETAGKLMGSAVIKEHIELESSRLMNFLRGLWNRFLNLFRSADEKYLQSQIKFLQGELAENVLKGNIEQFSEEKIDERNIKGNIEQFSEEKIDERNIKIKRNSKGEVLAPNGKVSKLFKNIEEIIADQIIPNEERKDITKERYIGGGGSALIFAQWLYQEKKYKEDEAYKISERREEYPEFKKLNKEYEKYVKDIIDKDVPFQKIIDIKKGKQFTQTEKKNIKIQAEQLYLQTQTREFKKWFGNSKIIDENNEPEIVYHFTNHEFNTFSRKLNIENNNTLSFHGEGFYFAWDSIKYKIFGKIKIPAFIRSENPYISEGNITKEQQAEKNGYDGVIADNEGFGIQETIDKSKELVVFEPNQIKSVFNIGTFSTTSDNILYQKETKESKSNLKEEKDKLTQLLDRTIQVLEKRYKIFKEKGGKIRTAYKETEGKKIDLLKTRLNNSEAALGMITFVDYVKEQVKKTLEDVDKLQKQLNSETSTDLDPHEISTTLRNMKLYISAFTPIIQELKDELPSIEDKTIKDLPELGKQLTELEGDLNSLDRRYYKIGVPIFAKSLLPFLAKSDITEDKLIEMMSSIDKDISFTERWLDSMSDTSDDILKFIDVLVRREKELVRESTNSIKNKLVRALKKFKEAGNKTQSVIYERLKNGKLSGYLISKVNVGQWQHNRISHSKYIQKKLGLPEDNIQRHKFLEGNNLTYAAYLYKNIDTFNIPKYTLDNIEKARQKLGYNDDFLLRVSHEIEVIYKLEWRKWFKLNSKVHPDLEKILIKKSKTLTKGEYEKYLEENYPLSAGGFRYAKGELSIPSSGEEIVYGKGKWKKVIQTVNYDNLNYSKLTKSQREFLDMINSVLTEMQELLPDKFQHTGLAPQIRKDLFERMQGGITKKKIGQEIKEAFSIVEDDTEFGDFRDLTDLEGNKVNFVPILFNNLMKDTSNLSTDIVTTLTMYSNMALNYDKMSRIVDTLELGKDILKDRKVIENQEQTILQKGIKGLQKIIVGHEVTTGTSKRTAERLEDFISMIVYGQVKDKGKTIAGKYSSTKILDWLAKYSAINGLAVNIFASTANVNYAEIMTSMEAFAGEFMDKKSYTKGSILYAKLLPKTLNEIGQLYKTNELDLWGERFNSLIDFEANLREINSDRTTRFGRLMGQSPLFMNTHVMEHTTQMRLSLSLAQFVKVKDNRGNEVPFYDAWEVKDNELVLKSEFKNTVTSDIIESFINRQYFINQRLHGIYNVHDKSAVQKAALGRLSLMFRKWIIPGFNRRYQKKHYMPLAGQEIEGYYTTTGNFMWELMKDLKKMQFSLATQWNTLSKHQKANIWRTLSETVTLLGLIVLLAFLGGDDDDNEEDSWIYNMYAYQINRMITELSFYIPGLGINETLRILKSPMAAIRQIENITHFMNDVMPWNFMDERQSGKYEGWKGWQVSGMKLIPMANTLYNIPYPEDKMKYFGTSN